MSEQLTKPDQDKEKLWGWWYKSKKWQDSLYRSAAHKSLDIPEAMGDINAPKTMISHNGINGLGLAAIAAVALGGWYVLKDKPQADPIQQPAPISAGVEDRDYTIKFYEQQPDGSYKPITVDRKPE